jgi:hypothetical protein
MGWDDRSWPEVSLRAIARNKRLPQVFDERGRTIPWMARTVHRLYNDQAQKILLDEENITIAHWIYLRVCAAQLLPLEAPLI